MRYIKYSLIALMVVLALPLILLLLVISFLDSVIATPIDLWRKHKLKRNIAGRWLSDGKYIVLQYPFDSSRKECLESHIVKPYRKHIVVRNSLKPERTDVRYKNEISTMIELLSSYDCNTYHASELMEEPPEDITLVAIYPDIRFEAYRPFDPTLDEYDNPVTAPEGESLAKLREATEKCISAWDEHSG